MAEDDHRHQRLRLEVALDPHLAVDEDYLSELHEIDLTQLLSENSIIDDLDDRYLTLQLLRIIAPNNQFNANIRNRQGRGNYGNRIVQMTYLRMYLCRIVSSVPSRSSEVVYIMQNGTSNNRIWSKCLDLRDNGTLTIGTIFRLVSPNLVDQEIGGIPLIKADQPSMVMRPPTILPETPINAHVEGDKCHAFTVNGATLHLSKTKVCETSCAGFFCDKQRADEIVRPTACGCFNMLGYRSRLAVAHNVTVRINDSNSTIITQKCFSSASFSRVYLKGLFPQNSNAGMFEHNNQYRELKNAATTNVSLVNLNGGWTVIGWYKRGMMTDRALIGNVEQLAENDTQVDGDVNYHIVKIIPTTRSHLEGVTEVGRQIDANKFHVSALNQF
jgi:hypothetical protein